MQSTGHTSASRSHLEPYANENRDGDAASAQTLEHAPFKVEVELLQTVSHRAEHVAAEHLESFYVSLDDIRHRRYDGMIITGAPVELLDFKTVDYWPELCEIFSGQRPTSFRRSTSAGAPQAGIYYHYGVENTSSREKMIGRLCP